MKKRKYSLGRRIISILLIVTLAVAPFSTSYKEVKAEGETSDKIASHEQEPVNGEVVEPEVPTSDHAISTVAEAAEAEEEAAEAEAEEVQSSWPILINSQSADISNNGFEFAPTIAYGEAVQFTLGGYTASVEPSVFRYLGAGEEITEDAAWSQWGEANAIVPGDYYLGYSFEVEGVAKFDLTGKYGVRIIQAQLKAPETLSWTGGSIAGWDQVIDTQQGSALEEATVQGYEVTLCKNGQIVGSPVQTGADTVAYDFVELMKEHGHGAYTFQVKALVSETAQDRYLASESSEVSGSASVVQVKVEGDSGIDSVTPTDSFLLIPGNESNNTREISATLKNDKYSFEQWSCASAEITITPNEPSTSATLRIADAYTGAVELNVVAKTKDTEPPKITEYKVEILGDGKTLGLTGKANDMQTGIVAYAFSTIDYVNGVENWQMVTDVDPIEPVVLEHTVEMQGAHYLYVKDGYGNTTRSESSIPATQVIYNEYYDNGTAEALTEYLLGDNTLTLRTPVRPGYLFEGWYTTQELNGTPITSLDQNSHRDNPIHIYGKWERQEITFQKDLEDIDITYDGKERSLDATVSNTAGTITYQWYKGDQLIPDATTSTYLVSSVADAGMYYAKVEIVLDGQPVEKKSQEANVKIAPKALTIAASNKTIGYAGEVPEYTLEYTGFVEGENADTIELTIGTVTCTYTKGGNADSYDITPSGFAAPNYSITHSKGTLKVEPIDVEGEGAGVDAELEYTTMVYTGENIEPNVTVTRAGEPLIEDVDYTIKYTDNKNVGTAKAKVEFKGNYQGRLEREYTITKSAFKPVISLENWVYGDTAKNPTLDRNDSNGEVSYYYAKSGETTFATVQPTAAGTYDVYAVVAATDNYEGVRTAQCTFTIQKRPITLTAPSGTRGYDGSSYSDTRYTMNGNIAGSDSFQSITVTGQITSVGTVDNIITYQLSSSTDQNNYNIQCINGKLTITAVSLAVPVNHKWQSGTPGMATWVAVTRQGLTVQYELKLYRAGTDGSEDTLVKTVYTESTEHLFAEAMKEDSEEASTTAGYYFTVMAKPYGGVNKNNYLQSDTSISSSNIYTVKVGVEKEEGVSIAQIGDKTEVILLQGENVSISTNAEAGYVLSDTVWSTKNTGILSFGNASNAATTLRVANSLDKPESGVIKAHAEDEKPVIESFEATASADYSQVTFALKAKDSKGITGWMITTSEQAPNVLDAQWKTETGYTMEGEETVMSAGSYYAYVKDDGGNVVRSKTPIAIYEIKFERGAEEATGSMPTHLFKVQNTTITLPPNGFAKEGYGFKNWSGSSGIYADGGTYAANIGDTLTAQWGNEQVSYNVAYYYMNINGSYNPTPLYTSTFTGVHGAQISISAPAIQDSRIGMSLDTTEEKDTSITLNQPNQTLNVYYKLNAYTITYTYKVPGADQDTTQIKSFLYGASVADYEKPTHEGYEFVGWLYGEAGKKPETMPNKNIIATGSFAPVEAEYLVNYYEENLPEVGQTNNSYTRKPMLTETKKAHHAEEITFAKQGAKELEGFQIKGVTVTKGQAGDANPSDTQITEQATGEVSVKEDHKLQVNYYYTRNSYDLTLNVWKGSRDNEKNRLYTYTEKRLYGETIDATSYENYNKDNWVKEPALVEGYELANYADWSTGQKPQKMPAGSVTVARDYIFRLTAYYKVEIHYEGDTEDQYQLAESLYYYSNEGKTVTVGDNNSCTVNYNDFNDSIDGFAYYTFNSEHEENKMTGTVTATDKEPGLLVLKLYFKRKAASTEIRYYYNAGNSETQTGAQVHIGTLTKSGTWGSNYDCEPLTLFEGKGELPEGYASNGAQIGETRAENYNFKANGYVVSYAGRHEMNGKTSWPGYKFTKASELNDHNNTVKFGNGVGNAADYINVYYTKVDPDDRYYLDVGYNPTKLEKAEDKSFHQMKETIDGIAYQIRVANKADVFEVIQSEGTVDNDYPGAVAYSRVYTYGELKSGYEAIIIGGTSYYKKTEEGQQYLYLIDDSNQFFKGNRTSYNFLQANNDEVGMAELKKYLADYKENHGDSAEPDYDDKVIGANYENNGFSSIIYGKEVKSSNYTFTFDYAATYRVTYNLGGSTCKEHVFTDNQIVEPQCQHPIFETREGYSIAWYRDSAFRAKASSFEIDEDTTLYGRYEKNTLDFHEYIYYELADTITIGEDNASYITAGNLTEAKVALGETLSSATTNDEEIDFVDGAGKLKKAKIEVTTYTYRGETVMIDRKYPCLTFQQVSMTDSYESYVKPGYHYDNTNSNNRLYGYCQVQAVPLSVYYARDTYAVTVIPNNAKVSNSETKEYRFGQTISIQKPTKNGYEFTGWNWEKSIPGAEDGVEKWEPWTDAPSNDGAGNLSFAMPSLKLRADAQWNVGTFDQTITHYFQDETQTYKTEWLKTLKTTQGSAIAVTFNESTLTEGKAHYDGSVLRGVSGRLEDGTVAWFSDATINDRAASVDVSDLIAIEQEVTATSEGNTKVSKYINGTFLMFSHAFTVYQEDITVKTLSQSEQFTNTYGMQVDYYYTRAADLQVRTVAKALDKGEPGTPIGGTLSSFYGQNIQLKLNLAEGYEFVGWYKAMDVLEGYTAEADLKTLSLISDISEVEAISTEADWSIRVTESLAYVAVTKAKAVSLPSVSVTGKDTYTYGYASTIENSLKAEVTLAESDASTTYVKGYQWYEDGEIIAGATSSTYLFPTGKDAKSYQYQCYVTVSRKDNGRTGQVITDSYEVTVKPATMNVEASGYSGIYDGQSHGIAVKVKAPEDQQTYQIYYSETELTKENYTSGQTDHLTYKDVNVDWQGQVTDRTVYYYVHNEAGNYIGDAGHATVRINPITLTAKAGKPYTKAYDGKAAIEGGVNEPNTGKYDLAHNEHYIVSGLLQADQGDKYLLDFSAEFDSKHVNEASHITLSNMVVVDGQQQRNYNYAFATGSNLIISGYISPFVLNVQWSDAEAITYDGTEHAPTIQLGEEQTPPNKIDIAVLGGQTNVGTYTAYAAVKESTDYQPGDYSFSVSSKEFIINKRPVTITPEEKESTYDATIQRITEFKVSDLVSGQTYTASTEQEGVKDAGDYVITAANLVIQAEGKTVTDNYEITYAEATLTIKPIDVKIKGIKALNKGYDATTNATLLLEDIQFDGLLQGEQLALDNTKISGSFDTAAVGKNKTVTLTMQEGVLSGSYSKNYKLNQNESQKSTSAEISHATIIVNADTVNTVYGEDAPFHVSYSGFKGSDTAESVITGTPSYTVKKNGEEAYKTYVKTAAAGTYNIKVDLNNLVASNYIFTEGTPATLEVKPRPVQVSAVSGKTVSKEYDGTTNAKELIQDEHYKFKGVSGNSASGVTNKDVLVLQEDPPTGFNANYNSKDVGTATSVTVADLALNNSNYELATTSFDVPGSITAKSLKVTADDTKIVYGDSEPTYTVSYGVKGADGVVTDGFVDGEVENVLSGTLAIDCAYDSSVVDNRKAGEYDITLSGYTNGNYDITYELGTLTVDKAMITVTANDKTFTYKTDQSLPEYTGVFSGYQYEDTDTVITGKDQVSYTCGATKSDVAGEYAIEVVLPSTLAAENYDFEAVKGKLTITKREITLSGITITDKVYDGTINLTGTQLAGEVMYTGIDSADESEKGFEFTSGQYSAAGVGDNIDVTFTVKLNEYLDQRYALSPTTQASASGKITKKALSIKAEPKTVQYGDPTTPYTVTYDGFVSEEGITDLSGALAFECAYTSTSEVGDYDIVPKGYTSVNYDVSFEKAELTVTQATLAPPTPVWDTENPGTVKWNAVPQIGSVTVATYTVVLHKGEVAIPETSKTVPGTNLRCDLLEAIRAQGAGAYTVKVKANASTEENSNKDKKNVLDSKDGTSLPIHAAKVSVGFNTDPITDKGKGDLTIHNANSEYIVVAGETDIPVQATLKNATGYQVDSWTGDTASLTITGGKQEKEKYTASVSWEKKLTSADPLILTLTLSATPATLQANVTADKVEASYNYTVEEAPRLTVDAKPDSGDNIASEGYAYTYQWKIQERQGDGWKDIQGATTKHLTFPQGYKAYDNYRVTCAVTATRDDNKLAKTLAAPTSVTITIKPAEFASVLTLEGWEYGASRKTPSVSYNPESKNVAYSYHKDNEAVEGWDEKMPTDAGVYYVRATIEKGVNYAEHRISPVAFTITKPKLNTPEDLTMMPSATAPYGKATWTAVEGPKENAGTEGNTESSIKVSYEVKLYRSSGESSSLWEAVKTYSTQDCAYDMTSDIADTGIYRFTVRAIATSTNGQENCNNSEESTASAELDVSGNISATGGIYEKNYDGGSIELTVNYEAEGDKTYQWYRNDKIIAEATNKSYEVTYVEQNGVYSCNITAGGQTFSSTHQQVTIKPRPITMVAASKDKVYDGSALTKSTWEYPVGTVDSEKVVTNEVLTCTMDQTITDVGSKANTISDVVIRRGETVLYQENGTNNNYTVNKTQGTLQIMPMSLSESGIQVSDPEGTTYDGTEKKQEVIITDGRIKDQLDKPKVLKEGIDYTIAYQNHIHAGTATITIQGKGNYAGELNKSFEIKKRSITLCSKDLTKPYDNTELKATGVSNVEVVEGQVLADGDVLTSVTFTGTQTNAGTSQNTYENVVIKNADDTDVTTDYIVVPQYGTLTVTKAQGTITINLDQTKTYDGIAVSDPVESDITKAGTGAVTYQYYTKDDADTYTLLTEQPKKAGIYYIRAEVQADTNYELSHSAYRQFEIKMRKIKLTADPQTSVYGEGIKELSYRVEMSDTDVSGSPVVPNDDLNIKIHSTVTPSSPVGTYDITITASNPNYDITAIKGTYTITTNIVTADVAGYMGVYDQTPHQIIVTPTPADATVYYGTKALTDTNYTTVGHTSNPSYTEAGSYQVYYYIHKANYTPLSGSASVTISKAAQVITADNKEVIYDGNTHSIIATTSGTGTISYTNNDKSNVGDYQVSIEASETNNYQKASKTVNLNINAKSIGQETSPTEGIEITTPEDRTYNGSAQMQTTVITDKSRNATEQELNMGTDYTISYSNHINAGTATITIQGIGNYAGELTQMFTINKRPITLRSKDMTKQYDNTELKATGVSNVEVVEGTVLAVGDVLASVTFTGTQTNAGTSQNTYENVVIKNAQKEEVTANYGLTLSEGTLTVNPIADTIVITGNLDKRYNGEPVDHPMFTRSGTGEVSYQYYAKEGETGPYTLLAQAPKDAGSYYVNVVEKAAGNYIESSAYQQFTIAKRAVTLRAEDKSSIYGEAQAALTYTAKMTDTTVDEPAIVGEDNLNISYQNAANLSSPVGTYDITITASNPNYDITAIKGTYTITANIVTAVVEGYTGVYDQTSHQITVTPTPADATVYYGTQALTDTNYTTAGSISNPSYTEAGSYQVYYYIHKDNYTPLSGSASVKISKAEQVITVDNVEATYDGSSHSIIATTSGGGIISYTNNTQTKAGEYTVGIKASETDNYNEAAKTATLVIKKRSITLCSKDLTKPYDNTELKATGVSNVEVVEGQVLADGDVLTSVTFTGTQTNAGTSQNTYENVVIKNAQKEEVTANYGLKLTEGTLTVNPIADTIVITGNLDKRYNGEPVDHPMYTRSGTGEVSYQYYAKEGETGPYTLLAQAPKDAGSYYVYVVEKAAGNYIESSAYQQFTIAKRAVTLRAEDKSSIYGEAQAALTYTAKMTDTTVDEPAIVGEDNLNISYQNAADLSSPVGTYDITITASNPNYDITAIKGTYTITANIVTAVVEGYTGVYDQTSHQITVTPTPADATVYYGTQALTDTNYTTVGHTSNPSYTDAGSYQVYYYIHKANYTPLSGSASVTISKAEQVITVDNVEATYDGSSHSIIATTDGGGIISYTNNTQTKAGEYTVGIKASETDNYNEAAKTATLVIKKRSITFQAASASKSYDGNSLVNQNYTIQEGTLADGDVINSIQVSGSQTDAGKSANSISNAIILASAAGEERTESYQMTYTAGVLEVEGSPQNQELGNGIRPGVIPDGVREQVSELQVRTGEENQQPTVSEGEGNPPGVALEDKKITKTEMMSYGTGNIKVIINSSQIKKKRIDAALVSSQQVINATLSEKEKLAIANGDSMEIRLIIEKEEEVPKKDADLIQNQIAEIRKTTSDLEFGQYLDISLAKRLNQGEWEHISEASEDIGIEFDIPKQLQFENTRYYVSRAHNNKVELLDDRDKNTEKITMFSKYFSTYAILYRLDKVKVCIWHIVILVVLAIYLLAVLTWKEERRKRYRVLLVGAVIMIMAASIAGTCIMDWPIAIGSTVFAAIAVPIKKRLSSSKNQTEHREVG